MNYLVAKVTPNDVTVIIDGKHKRIRKDSPDAELVIALVKQYNSCNILTESSADLFLSSTQTLVSANLYWSGSGGLPLSNYPGDYNVTLNGIPIFSERNFFLST